VASSLTIEDNRTSASELFCLLKLRRHTHNHNRLHIRLMYQRLNLYVPTCLSLSLSRKPARILTSTIRKSHGAQDHQESVRWPIEHQRLLQNQRLFRLQYLNHSLHPNLYLNKKHGAQILQLHMLKTDPMHGSPKPSRRQLCIRHSHNLLLHTKRHPELSALLRSYRELLPNLLLRTSPDRILLHQL
jgi:hypothetical protein